MRLGIIGLERQRALEMGERRVAFAQRLARRAHVAVRLGIVGRQHQGAGDELGRGAMVAALMRDDAEKMEAARVARRGGKRGAVKPLGRVQLARAVMAERRGDRLVRRHRARSRSSSATMRGACPQAARKRSRSPGAIAVVAVLTSGW